VSESEFIPSDLLLALRADGNRDLTQRLFRYCLGMGVAYLKVKSSAGRFQSAMLGLSIEDFALDAMAEVFKRDGEGHFPVFQALLRRCGTSNEAVHHELRRVVFGAINQHIFRTFRQIDPGLSKQIRNLKFALKNHAQAQLLHVKNEKVIAPRSGCLQLHLPLMPEELLRIDIWNNAPPGSALRDSLAALVNAIGHQTIYRRIYPVTAFAFLLRSADDTVAHANPETVSEFSMTEQDIESVSAIVVQQTVMGFLDAYASHGKLRREQIAAYRMAVVEILRESYFLGDGDGSSYYEMLKRHMPQLTRSEYLLDHRTKLEYVAKRAKKAMGLMLQAEFAISARVRSGNDTGM